jgi:hypothetical protein
MGLFNRRANTVREPELTPEEREARELFKLKADLIQSARGTAASENRRPTLEDYRLACEDYAKEHPERDNSVGNPRIAGDLSGQKLQGFAITDPTKAQPKERATNKLYDLDGKGAINDFYTNINFNEADLSQSYVDPATSFNDQIAKAKNHNGMTFNGMENGDSFTFNKGDYNNVSLTNVNGGEIEFKAGAKVRNLTINGTQASIHVGTGAELNTLTTNDDFRILTLNVDPHGAIRNADLSATLAMNSELQASVWEHVKLGNVSHVDFQNAAMNDVTINGDAKNAEFPGTLLKNVNFNGDIDRLNLTGAKVTDLYIKGALVTNADQLAQAGVQGFETVSISCSPEAVKENNQRIALAQAVAVGKSAAEGWMNPEAQQAKAEGLEATATNTALLAAQQQELTGRTVATLAPHIDMAAENKVQPQSRIMMDMANDNAPAELGQDRAQFRAVTEVALAQVVIKDGKAGIPVETVDQNSVKVQSNLQNLNAGKETQIG